VINKVFRSFNVGHPAPQPVKKRKRLGSNAFRARLRGKRVKSAFFETYGQPPIS